MRSNSCRNTFRAFSSIFFIVFFVCILSVFVRADTACDESANGIATLLSEQHYQADEPITVIYRIRFVWVYAIFTPLRDSLSNPLTFLYLIWPIGWILSIATQLCFFFPTVKKLKKKFSASEAEAV